MKNKAFKFQIKIIKIKHNNFIKTLVSLTNNMTILKINKHKLILIF